MATDLEQLVEAADRLCDTLDLESKNDKKFCDAIQAELERLSWASARICRDLKAIREYGI
jgi:hypothetical protein